MKVKCEACGTEYENPTSMICDNCGFRMSRTATMKGEAKADYLTCPSCGSRNKLEARICFNCGNLIRSPTP